MKIAFVDGPWPGHGHRTQRWAHKNPGGNINPPPLFQMYAAAIARQQGFGVKLWDAPASGIDFQELIEQIKEYNPQIVVVNTSTPSFEHDLKLIRMIKEACLVESCLVKSCLVRVYSKIRKDRRQKGEYF